MKKALRTIAGGFLVAVGVIFTILPGSILFVLAGLILLSMDYPKARVLLAMAQKSARKGAVKLDSLIRR